MWRKFRTVLLLAAQVATVGRLATSAVVVQAEAPDRRVYLAYHKEEKSEQIPSRATATPGDTNPAKSPLLTNHATSQLQLLPGPPKHTSHTVPDTAIQPASHETAHAGRHLPPPSQPLTSFGTEPRSIDKSISSRLKLPYLDSLGTAGTGLVVVVGLFFLCVALLKRSNASPAATLPRDAVVALGRTRLIGRHSAQLLQVGNKLVLVAVSPDSIDTITEVTDPAEVERLLSICMKSNKYSTTAEFQKVLQQMAKEPARGFLGSQPSAFSRSS